MAPAIPSYGMTPLRPPVRWFAERMQEQLAANDHKGGWRHDSDHWLFRRLVEEQEELHRTIMPSWYLDEDVIKEAADVANFAMFIATNRVGLGEPFIDPRDVERQRPDGAPPLRLAAGLTMVPDPEHEGGYYVRPVERE